MIEMKINFVDLKRQYEAIKGEIDACVNRVITSCNFVLGDEVNKFEEEFAAYCKSRFCVGVGSGTDALRLSLLAAGISSGDEVITVPNTFIATTLAISEVNAKIKFVDIDPETYTIDAARIEKAISEKTKAILPVHLYGNAADMAPIMEIAEKNNLAVIEDACQAHGADYKGKKVPTGNIGCFSFYPGKNLGCYGDGGAIVTNNEEIAEKIKMLRNYGQKIRYHHLIKGTNSRLDTIQAAVLRVKLRYIEKWNGSRRRHAKLYNELLGGVVELPVEKEYAKHVYHLYVIRTKKRDELQGYLSKKGIASLIHYPIPIHLQKAYSDLNLGEGSFPITERYANEILSLPMFPELADEEIAYICESIKEFVSSQNR